MREEYNSVLSTPIEADNIGCFGQYRYIGKTQISVELYSLTLLSAQHAEICFLPFTYIEIKMNILEEL